MSKIGHLHYVCPFRIEPSFPGVDDQFSMLWEWDSEYAEDHLLELAAWHDIQIIWTDRPRCSYSGHRVAHIGHPSTPVEYLVALHEFGHICSPRARNFERRYYRDQKEYDDYALCEAAAWAWAARFCDEELYEMVNEITWKMVGSLFASCLPWTHEQNLTHINKRERDKKTKLKR